MNNKEKKAIIGLFGAIGLIVLLLGLFTTAYDLVSGLVAAIAIWLFTGTLRKMLGADQKPSKKKAIFSLIGAIGLIVLLLGLFTTMYSFMNGLIAALVVWILDSILVTYFGVETRRKLVKKVAQVPVKSVKKTAKKTAKKTTTKSSAKKKTTKKKTVKKK